MVPQAAVPADSVLNAVEETGASGDVVAPATEAPAYAGTTEDTGTTSAAEAEAGDEG